MIDDWRLLKEAPFHSSIQGSSVLFTTKGTKAAKEAQRVDRQGTEERMIED